MENKPLRTATVTWITYRNFGTYLQAYALQQAMKSLGYENRILDDRRFVLSNPLRAFLGRWKRRLLGQPTAPANIAAYRDFRKQSESDERALNSVRPRPRLGTRIASYPCPSRIEAVPARSLQTKHS